MSKDKEAYGIPVPRGVQKDWAVYAPRGVRGFLTKQTVPEDWGQPVKCVAWNDRFRRCRLMVAHFENRRSATIRIDANGVSTVKFGDAQ